MRESCQRCAVCLHSGKAVENVGMALKVSSPLQLARCLESRDERHGILPDSIVHLI